ncbi:MAG: transposase [Bacteroidetes bacterium]|nr:transposase [Bacteroidota bacterium]MBL0066450.1 transposase [Bacteroidota bacterium]MBL0138898.1 transposase [Bacteroidota bacterium]
MKRKFSDSFKLLVVLESYSSKTELKTLAEKYEIELRLLKAWRKSYKDLAVSLAEERHSLSD